MPFSAITPDECADKLTRARNIAVLTGAGISTAAGVPDFRGPNGLYVTRRYDPDTVFEITAFDRDPKPFYQFSRDFLGLLRSIQPSFTHRFLAALEKTGREVTVITQNIDGLHQRAGSKTVLPVHGDYETARCRKCGKKYPGSDLVALMDAMEVPLCPHCGGVLKPEVVFFGEGVRHMYEAAKCCEASTVMLVLGSSLTVYPAASLPTQAGGEVVIVNQGPVGMQPGAGIYLADQDLDGFFQAVAAGMNLAVE